MRDALDGVMLFVAFVIGISVGGCVCNSSWEKRAILDGKAECYLDENNDKQWRWK